LSGKVKLPDWMRPSMLLTVVSPEDKGMREGAERERKKETERERERERKRQREKERKRERKRERGRERKRKRERERGRERVYALQGVERRVATQHGVENDTKTPQVARHANIQRERQTDRQR
jgi:hypothetical protein